MGREQGRREKRSPEDEYLKPAGPGQGTGPFGKWDGGRGWVCGSIKELGAWKKTVFKMRIIQHGDTPSLGAGLPSELVIIWRELLPWDGGGSVPRDQGILSPLYSLEGLEKQSHFQGRGARRKDKGL